MWISPVELLVPDTRPPDTFTVSKDAVWMWRKEKMNTVHATAMHERPAEIIRLDDMAIVFEVIICYSLAEAASS